MKDDTDILTNIIFWHRKPSPQTCPCGRALRYQNMSIYILCLFCLFWEFWQKWPQYITQHTNYIWISLYVYLFICFWIWLFCFSRIYRNFYRSGDCLAALADNQCDVEVRVYNNLFNYVCTKSETGESSYHLNHCPLGNAAVIINK